MLGWQSGTAASAFQTALEIQGLIVLNNSGYVYERWHGTLLTIAVVVFCSLFNTFLAKRLPLVEGIVLILHIVGFVAIIVVLWVLAPRSSAHDVFTQFLDGGNWGNMGLACLVGITSPVLSLLGSDAATHMSEELRDASKNLPKAMVSTLLFNGALGFVMLVTLCFSVGNLEDVLSTPTGFPFIQVFYNATLSKGAATVMTCVLVIMSAFCAVTNLATASRQLFSFARDSGMPFQSWLSHVSCTSFEHNDRTFLLFSAVANYVFPITGPRELGDPSERRHLHLQLLRPLLAHQHRLDCRLQPDLLTRPLRPALLVHRLHLLHGHQTNPRRTPPQLTVQAGQVWSPSQPCLHRLSDRCFRLHLLPERDASYPVDHELGIGHLRRRHGHFSPLLHLQGSLQVRRTGRVHQKGVLKGLNVDFVRVGYTSFFFSTCYLHIHDLYVWPLWRIEYGTI